MFFFHTSNTDKCYQYGKHNVFKEEYGQREEWIFEIIEMQVVHFIWTKSNHVDVFYKEGQCHMNLFRGWYTWLVCTSALLQASKQNAKRRHDAFPSISQRSAAIHQEDIWTDQSNLENYLKKALHKRFGTFENDLHTCSFHNYLTRKRINKDDEDDLHWYDCSREGN